MEKSLISKIVNTKSDIYFISPHFDDAVLSAGELMCYLSKTNRVTLINVFTKANGQHETLSAKEFTRQCGFKDSEKLFQIREKEDRKVLSHKVKQIINLGFNDACWRKKKKLNLLEKNLGRIIPELRHIYPTYKYDVAKGKVSKADKENIRTIGNRLNELAGNGNNIIFCPLGVGRHVDHVIIRNICSHLFNNCIYWVDYPYSISHSLDLKEVKNYFSFQVNQKEKTKMIKGYKSQYKSLFPRGIGFLPPELYFFNKVPSFD